MRRREFLASLATAAYAAEPPNILFLMPDQWRGMDLGSMGNQQVRTPHLDKLAADGAQFVNAVANTPVCTPARATLLTGKYPHATSTAVNDVRLPIHEVTMPEILRRHGYYNGFIGKWHLDGGIRMPGFVPPGDRRQGFDFWAANECSHAYFKQWYFRDDAQPIQIPRYEVFEWTDLAIEFLNNAKERRKPFCLSIQYGPPHDPYQVPPGYEGMYEPEKIELRKNWKTGSRSGSPKDIAGYYAAIACLDQEIGRLLDKLDQLGQRENTIVVVTSDHGDMLGSQGTFLKRKPWEESVRVPGIFRWPAGLKPGLRSTAPFSHVDAVPTLLGLCGVSSPVPMHGYNYAPFLRGQAPEASLPEQAMLMIYTPTELNEHPPWRGLRSRSWKYARHQDKPWVLYDLEKDPFEQSNLVADARHRSRIAGFDALIARHMETTGDRWDVLSDRPFR